MHRAEGGKRVGGQEAVLVGTAGDREDVLEAGGCLVEPAKLAVVGQPQSVEAFQLTCCVVNRSAHGQRGVVMRDRVVGAAGPRIGIGEATLDHRQQCLVPEFFGGADSQLIGFQGFVVMTAVDRQNAQPAEHRRLTVAVLAGAGGVEGHLVGVVPVVPVGANFEEGGQDAGQPPCLRHGADRDGVVHRRDEDGSLGRKPPQWVVADHRKGAVGTGPAQLAGQSRSVGWGGGAGLEMPGRHGRQRGAGLERALASDAATRRRLQLEQLPGDQAGEVVEAVAQLPCGIPSRHLQQLLVYQPLDGVLRGAGFHAERGRCQPDREVPGPQQPEQCHGSLVGSG